MSQIYNKAIHYASIATVLKRNFLISKVEKYFHYNWFNYYTHTR